MEIISTRCSQGRLIITDTHIIVELYNLKSSTLDRRSFTALDMKMAMFPLLWIDGLSNLTFHGQGGERLVVTNVKTKEAKRIKAILTGR